MSGFDDDSGEWEALDDRRRRVRTLLLVGAAAIVIVVGAVFLDYWSTERDAQARRAAKAAETEAARAECEAVIARFGDGELAPEDRSAAEYALLVRIADGQLVGRDLRLNPRTPFPCTEHVPDARKEIWQALADSATTASTAWADADASALMVKAVVERGGIDEDSRAQFAQGAESKVSAALQSATTVSDLGVAADTCSLSDSLGVEVRSCRALSRQVAALEAAEGRARDAEERAEASRGRERARQASAAIDAALGCFPPCLNQTVGGDSGRGAALDSCARYCSAEYGLTSSDWQSAFMDRCDPTPSSDYAAARCVMILGFVR